MTDRADGAAGQPDQDQPDGTGTPAPPTDSGTPAPLTDSGTPTPATDGTDLGTGTPAPLTGTDLGTGTPAPATDYTDAGVPTLDYLQGKIDRRYGTALGATELAEAGDEAQAERRAAADRERAAQDRLDEIRRSLGSDR